MEKNVPLTKEETQQFTEFIERYYQDYFVTGQLRNNFPTTFLGGDDENYTDVKASLVFAMKKDKRVEDIIKEAVKCFNDIPSMDELRGTIEGKNNG